MVSIDLRNIVLVFCHDNIPGFSQSESSVVVVTQMEVAVAASD